MKTYQIKVTVKKSKPPVWKRCLVPSGITFSQMALILDEIMEETADNGYEFEFYQAGIHLREWTGEENTVRKYNFDYMCASDTYVDSLMDNEEWFTFRSGNGDRQYRAEIEKRTAQEICYPSVIKQKESSGIQEWMDMEVMNRELEQLFRLRSAEPERRLIRRKCITVWTTRHSRCEERSGKECLDIKNQKENPVNRIL